VSPVDEPLRIFVGAAASEMIAAKVLEHTIRAHTRKRVEFSPMLGQQPWPKRKANRPRTSFSYKRFMIPKLAGYRGRALYMDSDMQVFADIAQVFALPFGEARVLCTRPPGIEEGAPVLASNSNKGRGMAFMMLDCSRLDWDADRIVLDLDAGKYTYGDLMQNLCLLPEHEVVEGIPSAWNSLECYEPGVTKNLHYTVIKTQPWRNDTNPLRAIWERAYRDTVDSGAIQREEVLDAIRFGWAKPGLADAFPGGRAAVDRLSFRVSCVATRAAKTIGRRFARNRDWAFEPRL